MNPEQKIDELYERIFSLKDRLYSQENTIEIAKDYIMHSNIPIVECMYLMDLLRFPEDKDCKSDSYFYPKEIINEELRRILWKI